MEKGHALTSKLDNVRAMEHRALGRSGLLVSRLALGTSPWGRETDADEAAAQLKAFIEAGGTLVDTAGVYADGDSEHLLGKLLANVIPRDQVILASKAGLTAEPPNTHRDPDADQPGLPSRRSPRGARPRNASRSHLVSALDASLHRLGTDHVDLWQVHCWDPVTPLEETLSALDFAVSTGRARYVGIANYAGWQLAKAATWQAIQGGCRLVSAQVEYSLLTRDAERDLLPAALDASVSILPWSPVGRGVLAGKYRPGPSTESVVAFPTPERPPSRLLNERSAGVMEAVATAADGLGVSPLAVSLAWVRDRPGVVAPVVVARTAAQLRLALQSEELVLPTEIRQALDDVSAPPPATSDSVVF